jgi:ABC-2 type transport system permease protein
MYALLARNRVRMWRNAVLRSRNPAGRALQILLAGAGMAAIGWFFFLTAEGVFTEVAARDPALARASLRLLFVMVVILVLSTEVGSLVHELYLASDLDLLLSTPLSLRSLFLFKLTEAAIAGGLAGLLGLAALAGYAYALEAPLTFWLLAPLVMAVVVVLTAALSMLVVLLVMRVVPAGKMRGILTLLGATLGALLWLLLQTTRISSGDIDRIAPFVDRFGDRTAWAPTTWAAEALVAVQDGQWPRFAIAVALLAAAAAVLIVPAALLFQYSFYVSQGRVQEAPARARGTARAARGRFVVRAGELLDGPVWAVVMKDWRTLARDLRLLSALLFPLVMFGFFTYQLLSGVRTGAEGTGTERFWRGLAAVPMLPFFFGGQLTLLSLGQEGRNFAILRGAPLTIAQLLAAKFLAGFLLILGITWGVVLLLGLWVHGSMADMLAALAMAGWLAAGSVLANLAAAAVAPKFEADNPRQSVGVLGRVVAIILGMAFVGASSALCAWLVIVALRGWPDGGQTAALVTLALAAVVAVVVAAIAAVTWLGARRLAAWQLES